MSPEERRARAIRIHTLMEQDDIKQAFKDIAAELTDEWRRCQTTEERENLWRAVNGMDRLQTWLLSAASHDLTALRRAK